MMTQPSTPPGRFPPPNIPGANYYRFVRGDDSAPVLATLSGRAPKDTVRNGATHAEIIRSSRDGYHGIAAYLNDGSIECWEYEAAPPTTKKQVGQMLTYATVSGRQGPIIARHSIDWQGLARMVTDHQVSESKDGPGWVPGVIDPGPRLGERVTQWDVLVLDVEADAETLSDKVTKRVTGPLPPALPELAAEIELRGWAAALATSYSHEGTAEMGTLGPRYRVVLAISRPLAPTEIKPLGLAVAGLLGLGDCIDTKCLEPSRLFYLPRIPTARKAVAERAILDGHPLDVDKLLTQARQASATPARKAGNTSASVIDAFNEQADFSYILEPHGYEPKGRNRWMWAGSTSGLPGVVLLPKTGRIYSHHGGDPLACEHSHDAFSAWCILAHGGDYRAAVKEAARLMGMDRQRSDATEVDFSALLKGTRDTSCKGDTEASDAPRLRVVSVADVLTHEEPPHPFLWGPYVPTEALTLLGAHGGVGKSGLSLQLAAHIAMGREFLGLPVTRTPSLFFSAEDAGSVVRRRLAALCRGEGFDPGALADVFHVLDATDAATLFLEDARERRASTTETYAELAQFIETREIGFLVVDNSSDTFGGNAFDRAQVTQFVRALVRLVRARGGAVLLLSHVAKSTARAGSKQQNTEGYADSAAWNNAARSRLFMFEDDGGNVVVEHQKSNYGFKAEPLRLARLAGCGMRVADAAGTLADNPARNLLDNSNKRQLLALVHEFYERGEWASPSPSSPTTNAYALLHKEPGFPAGLDKGQTLALFRAMQRSELIKSESYSKLNRHPGERWNITDAGFLFMGLNPKHVAPTAPTCADPTVLDVDAVGAVPPEGDAPTWCASTSGVIGGSDAAQTLAQTLTQVTETTHAQDRPHEVDAPEAGADCQVEA